MHISKKRTPKAMQPGDYYNGKYGRMIACPKCGVIVRVSDSNIRDGSTAQNLNTWSLSCGCPNRHHFRVNNNEITMEL